MFPQSERLSRDRVADQVHGHGRGKLASGRAPDPARRSLWGPLRRQGRHLRRRRLFCDDDAAYEAVLAAVTPAAVATHFGELVRGPVERYEARNVLAIKFVLHDALGGGAPRSLRSDNLGKTFSSALLRMEIEVPEDVAAGAQRVCGRPCPTGTACGADAAAAFSAGAAQREELVEDGGERRRASASTSASVLDQPTDTRRLRWASTPIASRTGDGSSASDEQRRPGVGGDAGPVEAEEHGLRLDLVERRGRRGGGATRSVPGRRTGARPSSAARPASDPVGEPSLRGGLRPRRRSARGGRAEADDGGHVLDAGPAGPLLVAADEQRPEAQAPPDEQRAGARAGRRTCAPHRQQVGAEVVEVDRHVTGRLRRRRRARARRGRGTPATTSATAARVPTSWLPHWRCTSGGVGPDGGEQLVGVDPAGGVDADDGRPRRAPRPRPAPPSARRRRAPGARPARPLPSTAAAIASVAPLVNTTSRLRAPEQRGDLLAGLLDRDPGGEALGVDAAGVAAPGVEPRRPCASPRLGPQRRRRRVVEVVPRVAARSVDGGDADVVAHRASDDSVRRRRCRRRARRACP